MVSTPKLKQKRDLCDRNSAEGFHQHGNTCIALQELRKLCHEKSEYSASQHSMSGCQLRCQLLCSLQLPHPGLVLQTWHIRQLATSCNQPIPNPAPSVFWESAPLLLTDSQTWVTAVKLSTVGFILEFFCVWEISINTDDQLKGWADYSLSLSCAVIRNILISCKKNIFSTASKCKVHVQYSLEYASGQQSGTGSELLQNLFASADHTSELKAILH